jgi:hypothetical protein
MSSISSLPSSILSLLTKNSTDTSSSNSAESSTTSKTATTTTNTSTSKSTDDWTLSDLDSYVSSMKANQTTLADYMEDSSSDSGVYSVLTYGQDAKVQNILQQMAEQKSVATSTSSTASQDKVSATTK